MGFSERSLLEGEEIVLDVRPHWVALIAPLVVTAVIAVAYGWAVMTFVGAGTQPILVKAITWGGGAIAAALFLAFPARRIASWSTAHLVVTTDRVIHRQGLIARSSMEIPLEALTDVRFRQGILERLLGAGDLILESAGERGRQVFGDVRDPEAIQRVIHEQGEENKRRMYGGAVEAPFSVAAELERLADLRARGVLDEDEFQREKRRLLDR